MLVMVIKMDVCANRASHSCPRLYQVCDVLTTCSENFYIIQDGSDETMNSHNINKKEINRERKV